LRSSSGRGPRKPDEERKDYLIQARVPRELDDVLKQDAKRQRLSVSHLIRNVLEDTYKLVDGVISDVDTIVQESVELTGRMRRDARELTRSAARVREAHVQERGAADARKAAESERPSEERPHHARGTSTNTPQPRGMREPQRQHREPPPPAPSAISTAKLPEPAPHDDAASSAQRSFEDRTADVYAWNPVVLNRAARCERCDATLTRGETGHLGLSQDPTAAPRWLCGNCLASL